MRVIFFLVLFGTACSSEIRSEPTGMRDAVAGEMNPAVQAEQAVCYNAIESADALDEGYSLSAFGHFNPYPPVAPVKSPEDISVRPVSIAHQDLLACVPEGAFKFDVLEAGVLNAGSKSDLHPLGVFVTEGGNFLALYLHKDYETTDGEGVTIEVAGLLMDSTGHVLGAEQELSSWYEYEGSIRIRDFVYTDGSIVTSEQVYDPSGRDSVGNPLDYVDLSGTSAFKKYQLGQDQGP